MMNMVDKILPLILLFGLSGGIGGIGAANATGQSMTRPEQLSQQTANQNSPPEGHQQASGEILAGDVQTGQCINLEGEVWKVEGVNPNAPRGDEVIIRYMYGSRNLDRNRTFTTSANQRTNIVDCGFFQ